MTGRSLYVRRPLSTWIVERTAAAHPIANNTWRLENKTLRSAAGWRIIGSLLSACEEGCQPRHTKNLTLSEAETGPEDLNVPLRRFQYLPLLSRWDQPAAHVIVCWCSLSSPQRTSDFINDPCELRCLIMAANGLIVVNPISSSLPRFSFNID